MILFLTRRFSFQSTPSAWRETVVSGQNAEGNTISIHSLRMEGDNFFYLIHNIVKHFNPLPPHGGRLLRFFSLFFVSKFQSTPSAWRETGGRISSQRRPKGFQSTPSAWRETYVPMFFLLSGIFQSTPSAWRETSKADSAAKQSQISIHSLRMEGDFQHVTQLRQYRIFQSTPSAWRETCFFFRETAHQFKFQSTPSAWRETLCPGGNMVHIVISIHSLRMEGDCRRRGRGTGRGHFNPLPPHGGRHLPPRRSQHGNYFNPLPPHGGRLNILWVLSGKLYFNPLPPHGGRRCTDVLLLSIREDFNPLPPHGGRRRLIVLYSLRDIFQSTPSAWRETDTIFPCLRYLIFQSTPSAWRETGGILGKMRAGMHFNPLPPHGGRRTVCGKRFRIEKFQSTPSAWRETRLYLRLEVFFSYFNPLPPHGGRRTQRRAEASGRAISIHSLRMEGDPTWKQSVIRLQDFNPLPPHGGRRNDLPEVTQ